VSEIEEVPLRARLLSEDLVVFKDRSGAVGVLHLHCSHRGTSLEYGRVEEHGLRCCYHGRVFDVDGSVLEMPGERNADKLSKKFKQGAYPTHVFAGMVFVYMGPLEKIPPFPMYDKYVLPGMKLVPGPRLPFPCNWVQVQENAMDPAHTAILHAWEGMFATEFGKFPEITWCETPIGMAYIAARRVEEKLWARSTDIMMPTIRSLTSVFEDGKTEKPCSPPWMTVWTAPVDDRMSINFNLCHVSIDDHTPPEIRNRAMIDNGGQTGDRPYAVRQRVPGDYDAITTQGELPAHSLEQLGTLDRGVAKFRQLLRQGIKDVQEGRDPHGLLRTSEPVPSYSSDLVVPVAAMNGDPDDPDDLLAFAERVRDEYLQTPPLSNTALIPAPPPVPKRRYTFKEAPAETTGSAG